MGAKKYVSLLLRIGIAFAFIYVALSAYFTPSSWIGSIPDFVAFVSKDLILKVHITINLILGLWLLSNKKTFYAAIISSLALFSIIILNLGALDIVFRDISILFADIALAVLSWENR